MCGLAGFSLTKGSKVNSRELAHALLTQIESRGTDAAGWAYTTREGRDDMFKRATPGSQLSLKGMPRRADSVILHTRMATQGHQSNNENNHPLSSPNGTIRLVHNGVIANDWELKGMLTGDFPEVDSSVLPAMIEEYTVEGMSLVAGYAAIAWLDQTTNNTLHLARLDTSPVEIARLLDGSIVFASTEGLLARALKAAGLEWIGDYPNTFYSMAEGEYLQVTDGIITLQDNLGWFQDYDYRYNPAMAASQGGSVYGTTPAQEDIYGYLDSSGVWHDWSEEDATWPDEDEFNQYNRGVTSAMALSDGYSGASKGGKFYIMDHDRDYVDFHSLRTLVEYLLIAGENAEMALTEDPDIAWVNAVLDVGTVSDDGSLVSWVLEPEILDNLMRYVEPDLGFVADGVQILRNVLVS
jgi:hypothetical protein